MFGIIANEFEDAAEQLLALVNFEGEGAGSEEAEPFLKLEEALGEYRRHSTPDNLDALMSRFFSAFSAYSELLDSELLEEPVEEE